MLVLATVSSFLGSLWFSALLCVAGYVAGSIYPASKLFDKR